MTEILSGCAVRAAIQQQAVTHHAVRGMPKGGGEALTLRLFPDKDRAIEYALGVNMARWDDVWVELREVAFEEYTEPQFPWSVQWIGGFAYLVDASGRKLASLLGCQQQREFVAAYFHEITRQHQTPPAPRNT